jgi:hypothetical protein
MSNVMVEFCKGWWHTNGDVYYVHKPLSFTPPLESHNFSSRTSPVAARAETEDRSP